MNRIWRRWIRPRLAAPPGEPRRVTAARRAAIALGLILLVAEFAVALQYSGTVGAILIASTAGLAAFVYRGLQALATASVQAEDPDAHRHLVDPETRLPNRQQLIDTLARDIARAERYRHPVTLAVVRIAQYEDIRTAWGAGTARQAVEHVAETLVRITRASDFVARLDETRFAVILLQCTGAQAAAYTDRVTLAVSNRPVRSSAHLKVPLYVGVEVTALEYDAARFRGPLEFLSQAGGDLILQAVRPPRAQRSALAHDPRAMRQQLVRDYYPDGDVKDFAEAYREARSRSRHAG
ncbi:diguanylate cyclase [Tepidiforma flava]|uniref:Diguanylate cyclase n=1 Tax=Tepidiforma flava TaxID=3004094 RepID=A0ABY7M5P3_9CHLR|nr:diguanylate cyclase [Tepidiforma flava]WBL35096.1 diguanylate cyclase [Tepidiforma flava]